MWHPINLNFAEDGGRLPLGIPSDSDDTRDAHFRDDCSQVSITNPPQSFGHRTRQFVGCDVLSSIVEHPEGAMVDDVEVLAHRLGRFVVFREK